MSVKNNYKAKWEALKAEKETGYQQCAELRPIVKNAQITNSNAIIEFNKTHKSLMETAIAAKSLVKLMDDTRHVGTVVFGEVSGMIDEKIPHMDMQTIARRTRDILRMSAARIGVLSAAYEELEETVTGLRTEVQELSKQTKSLQGTLVSSVYIGHKPTASEVEDMTDTSSKDRYRRYGVEYEDLDDDWEETTLFENSVLRERRRSISSNEDDDPDSDDEYTTSKTLALVNRSAHVVPRSHAQDIAL